VAGYDNFRSIGPVIANVHATGLRTTLRRRNLGAELPLLADGSPRPSAVFQPQVLSGSNAPAPEPWGNSII